MACWWSLLCKNLPFLLAFRHNLFFWRFIVRVRILVVMSWLIVSHIWFGWRFISFQDKALLSSFFSQLFLYISTTFNGLSTRIYVSR